MKKIIIIIRFLILIFLVCFVFSALNAKQAIVFEMSRSDKGNDPPANLHEGDVYYALTDDNSLIWAYGTGALETMTYATFFDNIYEKGIVKINDEDASILKKYTKRIENHYKKVPLNYNHQVGVTDGIEFVVSYKGDFYNSYALKNKKNINDKTFYEMEFEIEKIINNYKAIYKDANEYVYKNNNMVWYNYLEFQEQD